ncbi:MAG: hypothetical protein JWM91_1226 [Rhodospirillales bacterium]|nr:hypothetical protein [Rhodospirillales bacterium]
MRLQIQDAQDAPLNRDVCFSTTLAGINHDSPNQRAKDIAGDRSILGILFEYALKFSDSSLVELG